jgi:paraquat-inducible protein A
MRRTLTILLAVLYFVGAGVDAGNIIVRTQGSTNAIEKILNLYSFQNEGAQTLKHFDEKHPFLGFFASSTIQHSLQLSTPDESDVALHHELPHYLNLVREESKWAAWWSWGLLCLSVLYVVIVMLMERKLIARPVLFALTSVSLIFFFIGILAPAMVIWTAPNIPMEGGTINFVVQHQVRGIAAIIWDLLTAGHSIVGGFLLLFSICTPVTKASLTYFAVVSRNKKLNFKIGEFLHTIGKWSMADVFVAAILLALYALKFQEATKSVPCLGLYYFIGYCLLSLITTELLTRSAITGAQREQATKGELEINFVLGLLAAVFCFVSLSGLYTYKQYTANAKNEIKNPMSPAQLDNAHLVLPAHKSE